MFSVTSYLCAAGLIALSGTPASGYTERNFFLAELQLLLLLSPITPCGHESLSLGFMVTEHFTIPFQYFIPYWSAIATYVAVFLEMETKSFFFVPNNIPS